MDTRTRMFRTLGCLVVAMTGSAAWLGWIDPSVPHVAEAPAFDVVLRYARSLVTDNVVIRNNRWHSVEIVAGPARAVRPAFLAATSSAAEHHFRVDLNGRASRTTRWSRQEASPGGTDRVRIQVARTKPGQPMSRAQWRCVQALITALSEGVVLSVHLGDEWAQTYGMKPGTLLSATAHVDSPG